MGLTRPLENPATAYGEALRALGAAEPALRVVSFPGELEPLVREFRGTFPDRVVDAAADQLLASAGELVAPGHPVVVPTSLSRLVGSEFTRFHALLADPRPLHLVALGGFAALPAEGAAVLNDLAILRGIPHLTLVAPADAPSTGAALRAVSKEPGPSFLRLPALDPIPTVTDGRLELGRSPELRTGDDLTLGAVGPLLAVALDASDELARVGVAARVLDFASVKPFDTKAIVRAARETGAILCLEEHQSANGVGSLVASITAENHPVPVRRMGVPDLAVAFGGGRGEVEAQLGLTVARVLEEAWELLRMKGKVQ